MEIPMAHGTNAKQTCYEQLAVTERTWFRMVEKDVIIADRHMSELPPIMSCFNFKHNLTIMGHGTANFAHSLAILSILPPAQSSQTPKTGRIHTRTLAWSGVAGWLHKGVSLFL